MRARLHLTRLTDAEAMRLRAALRNLRGLYGTWAGLADAIGVPQGTIVSFVHGAHDAPNSLLVMAARTAGSAVSRVARRCPHCGAERRIR